MYPADEPGLAALVEAHMQGDTTWPPRYAREQGSSHWLGERTTLGRWVALEEGLVIGHVGISRVDAGEKAERWTAHLGCSRERLAEIGRLVVHPSRRRARVSEALTRRCVREIVGEGYVPVACAFETAQASLAMMTGLGWRIVGSVQGRRSGQTIMLLVPPVQLVVAALEVAFRADGWDEPGANGIVNALSQP